MAESSATPEAPTALRLPVTLLTGFLGAGKTTRLNATLSSGREKVAVIENEIGALGVDSALVANKHDDGVIELTNGCLCCSAEVDLVSALEALAKRRKTSPFDRVIIETTGLADIAPVAALIGDPEDPLAEDFYLDGAVTVVDAANFRRWAGENALARTTGDAEVGPIAAWTSGFGATATTPSVTPEALRAGPGREAALVAFWKQVVLADQVIISKVDLAGEQAVEDVRLSVIAVNPLAQVLTDAMGVVGPLPPPLAFREEERGWLAAAAAMTLQRTSRGAGLCHSSEKRRRGAAHLTGVSTITLRLPADQLLCAARLQGLVVSLLGGCSTAPGGEDWQTGEGVGEAWRVKGLVAVEGTGPALLQGVGDQVTLEPWPKGFEAPFLVIIGDRLSQERIEAAVVACTASMSPSLHDAA